MTDEDQDWGPDEDQDQELSRDRALVRALMRRAAKARTDPAAFFEFVMREETTRARIRTLPTIVRVSKPVVPRTWNQKRSKT